MIPATKIEIDRSALRMTTEGVHYPVVGFGTSPLKGDVCTNAVTRAAEIGYRIIDTATFYKNFNAIAKAMQNQDRRQFYVISKAWYTDHSPADLKRDIESTLEELQMDYLDAYLLHWPNSQIPIEGTLTTMEELRQVKKIRHIGLSNVTINHLKRALKVGVPITWVQNEMNPNFYEPELLKFCEQHSIAFQAWSPLGSKRICSDAMLAKIGVKYGKTPSQVAIRWIVQHGCVPLPKSTNEQHQKENFDVADFILSPEDMEEIDQRAKAGQRTRYSKEKLGFSDEFDFRYEQCWPVQK